VVELVNAVLEARVTFGGVEPFLRDLRKPRVFVHADDAAQSWTWISERPAILASLDEGDGWPIGAPKPGTSARSSVASAATETVADPAFAFGLLKEVSEGDVLLCGTGAALAASRAIGRDDFARLMIDCGAAWRLHRATVESNLPGFGNEFKEWVGAARRGYRKVSSRKRLSARDQLVGGQQIIHAMLLYLALAAKRGDFSS